MICVDNSEWMRNGDYCPSRFAQQSDAVAIICNAKLQVSLLSLARACVSPPQAVTLLFARVLAFSGAASDGFVSGAVDLVRSGEPGELGGGAGHGGQGQRDHHAHQRFRRSPRTHARYAKSPLAT